VYNIDKYQFHIHDKNTYKDTQPIGPIRHLIIYIQYTNCDQDIVFKMDLNKFKFAAQYQISENGQSIYYHVSLLAITYYTAKFSLTHMLKNKKFYYFVLVISNKKYLIFRIRHVVIRTHHL
jgi:hypothetical protein